MAYTQLSDAEELKVRDALIGIGSARDMSVEQRAAVVKDALDKGLDPNERLGRSSTGQEGSSLNTIVKAHQHDEYKANHPDTAAVAAELEKDLKARGAQPAHPADPAHAATPPKTIKVSGEDDHPTREQQWREIAQATGQQLGMSPDQIQQGMKVVQSHPAIIAAGGITNLLGAKMVEVERAHDGHYSTDRDVVATTLAAQAMLQGQGKDIGKAGVDGKLGKDTEEAVKEFQHEHGLAATGKLDKKTMTALHDASEHTIQQGQQQQQQAPGTGAAPGQIQLGAPTEQHVTVGGVAGAAVHTFGSTDQVKEFEAKLGVANADGRIDRETAAKVEQHIRDHGGADIADARGRTHHLTPEQAIAALENRGNRNPAMAAAVMESVAKDVGAETSPTEPQRGHHGRDHDSGFGGIDGHTIREASTGMRHVTGLQHAVETGRPAGIASAAGKVLSHII